MFVVLETNVLVSGLYAPEGRPAQILRLIQNGAIVACYDYRILTEYRSVLSRAKFNFVPETVHQWLAFFQREGRPVNAPVSNIHFDDVSDKKFYEVARYCRAALITGNIKHFPQETFIMNPAQFLNSIQLGLFS